MMNINKQLKRINFEYQKLQDEINSVYFIPSVSPTPEEFKSDIKDWYDFISDQMSFLNRNNDAWIMLEATSEIITAINQLNEILKGKINLQDFESAIVAIQSTLLFEHLRKSKSSEKYLDRFDELVRNSILNIEETVDNQKKSLSGFAREIRDEVVMSINNASSSNLNEIQLEQSKSLNYFNEQASKEIGKINSRIEKEVREFEAKKDEITEVLGEISTAYQAGANTIQADKEKKSADTYRITGIIGLITTIFCSIWLFNDYIHFFGKPSGIVPSIDELSIGWFALRFTTITLLTAPSIYMLNESAYHRSKENLYRQRGTQLASIGAYLGELEPHERAEMKKELANNFFSFHNEDVDKSNVPDFIKQMKETLEIVKSISPNIDSGKSSPKDNHK